MTSTIVYVTASGAHLLTDGASFGADGKTVALGQKVVIRAHQNAAIAARGPTMFGGLLEVMVGHQQGTFDDLASAFPSLCRRAHHGVLHAALSGMPILGDAALVDAVLVGWSQREGYQAFAVSSCDGTVPAWEAQSLLSDSPLAYCSPFDEAMVARLRVQGVDVWGNQVDPMTDGLAIMREQRRSTEIVDGFCQMTSVLTSGVFSTILERWPAKAAPLPGLPIGRAA